VITGVSTAFSSEFAAPIKLTKGIDEMSGVLQSPKPAYQICRAINDDLYPHRFRFVVVRGHLDIGIKSGDASLMDGPAFHLASKLLGEAKQRKYIYFFDMGLSKKQESINEWLTVTANLAETIVSQRSRRQREIVALYDELGVQEEVAGRLGITQQAVSDALLHANWNAVNEAERVIDRALADIAS
jgi:hypothetical protein